MIVVDTSALMAIVLDEPEADVCIAALEAEDDILISAGTVAEALIVASRRNVGEELSGLIDGLGFEIAAVTPASGVASPGLTRNGVRAFTRPRSISVTASPMKSRRNMPAACFMSATIFRRRMSKALSKEQSTDDRQSCFAARSSRPSRSG